MCSGIMAAWKIYLELNNGDDPLVGGKFTYILDLTADWPDQHFQLQAQLTLEKVKLYMLESNVQLLKHFCSVLGGFLRIFNIPADKQQRCGEPRGFDHRAAICVFRRQTGEHVLRPDTEPHAASCSHTASSLSQDLEYVSYKPSKATVQCKSNLGNTN
jgi:hypothetical protein